MSAVEPLDPEVRAMAALGYVVIAAEHLGVVDDPSEEWDLYMYARAVWEFIKTITPLTEEATNFGDYRGIEVFTGKELYDRSRPMVRNVTPWRDAS